MSDQFDAHATAEKVEHLANDYMNSMSKEREYPIEAAQEEIKIGKAFVDEIKPLWDDPAKMKAVGIEMEKLSNATFSLLPRVDFHLDDQGDVTRLGFAQQTFFYYPGQANYLSSSKQEPLAKHY